MADLLLTIAGWALTFVLGFLTGRHHRHEHQWSAWSPWMVDTHYDIVKAVRDRGCETCHHRIRQEAGYHHCHDADRYRECTHIWSLLESESERLKRMERDLGLG